MMNSTTSSRMRVVMPLHTNSGASGREPTPQTQEHSLRFESIRCHSNTVLTDRLSNQDADHAPLSRHRELDTLLRDEHETFAVLQHDRSQVTLRGQLLPKQGQTMTGTQQRQRPEGETGREQV